MKSKSAAVNRARQFALTIGTSSCAMCASMASKIADCLLWPDPILSVRKIRVDSDNKRLARCTNTDLTQSRRVKEMNTLNKVTTWNPLREIDEPQNRLHQFFLGGFPNRMGRGEIHSLTVADWSPEVDVSEDDHGYLLKADLPEMKKDDVRVTVEDGILSVSG